MRLKILFALCFIGLLLTSSSADDFIEPGNNELWIIDFEGDPVGPVSGDSPFDTAVLMEDNDQFSGLIEYRDENDHLNTTFEVTNSTAYSDNHSLNVTTSSIQDQPMVTLFHTNNWAFNFGSVGSTVQLSLSIFIKGPVDTSMTGEWSTGSVLSYVDLIDPSDTDTSDLNPLERYPLKYDKLQQVEPVEQEGMWHQFNYSTEVIIDDWQYDDGEAESVGPYNTLLDFGFGIFNSGEESQFVLDYFVMEAEVVDEPNQSRIPTSPIVLASPFILAVCRRLYKNSDESI